MQATDLEVLTPPPDTDDVRELDLHQRRVVLRGDPFTFSTAGIKFSIRQLTRLEALDFFESFNAQPDSLWEWLVKLSRPTGLRGKLLSLLVGKQNLLESVVPAVRMSALMSDFGAWCAFVKKNISRWNPTNHQAARQAQLTLSLKEKGYTEVEVDFLPNWTGSII